MTEQHSFTDISSSTLAGSPDSPSEDWIYAAPNLLVVLDGATARTDTGCTHGIHWYAEHLGKALVKLAEDPEQELVKVLAEAISQVAAEHANCDLKHPGTPSARVAMLRPNGHYLVLGDVTVIADAHDSPTVIVDPRVELTGRAEREEVNRHLIGTPEKAAALLPMKRAELAARNTPGGYWIAAADPTAAQHALTGRLDLPGRAAVLTDGAARAVTFDLMSWTELLDVLTTDGAGELLAAVRRAESEDPLGARWPRNKSSDDASAVFAKVAASSRRTETR